MIKQCSRCGSDVIRNPSKLRSSTVTCSNCRRDRCLNPSNGYYARYGGRGISVCSEWRNAFDAFFEYMGPKPSPRHSIGRIDNDGNYEPGNVEWQTTKQQNSNHSRNHFLTYRGVRMTLQQWAEKLDIHQVQGSVPP